MFVAVVVVLVVMVMVVSLVLFLLLLLLFASGGYRCCLGAVVSGCCCGGLRSLWFLSQVVVVGVASYWLCFVGGDGGGSCSCDFVMLFHFARCLVLFFAVCCLMLSVAVVLASHDVVVFSRVVGVSCSFSLMLPPPWTGNLV